MMRDDRLIWTLTSNALFQQLVNIRILDKLQLYVGMLQGSVNKLMTGGKGNSKVQVLGHHGTSVDMPQTHLRVG